MLKTMSGPEAYIPKWRVCVPMSREKLSYFTRRAAQESAAALAASSEVAADIHRTLAARFTELAANEAAMDDANSIHPQMELRQG